MEFTSFFPPFFLPHIEWIGLLTFYKKLNFTNIFFEPPRKLIVYIELFTLAAGPNEGSSKGDSKDRAISISSDEDDTTHQDKGKGKANNEEDKQQEDSSNLLNYFNNLVEKRDALQAQYEYANREWNLSGSNKDKAYMDSIGKELDETQEAIDDLVAYEGFLDPADDIQEEDEE